MPSPPPIAYSHVGKSFGGARVSDRVVAVDDVSLEVAEGEFLAIVGGSGSGKTTLLRLGNRLIEGGRGAPPLEGGGVGAGRRLHHDRGRGCARGRSDPAAPAHRLCLPERRPVSAHERGRQYRDHAKS